MWAQLRASPINWSQRCAKETEIRPGRRTQVGASDHSMVHITCGYHSLTTAASKQTECPRAGSEVARIRHNSGLLKNILWTCFGPDLASKSHCFAVPWVSNDSRTLTLLDLIRFTSSCVVMEPGHCDREWNGTGKWIMVQSSAQPLGNDTPCMTLGWSHIFFSLSFFLLYKLEYSLFIFYLFLLVGG